MKAKVSTSYLASVYGVTRQAVEKWRKLDGFPYERLSERVIVYDLAEVEQYFKNKAKK